MVHKVAKTIKND